MDGSAVGGTIRERVIGERLRGRRRRTKRLDFLGNRDRLGTFSIAGMMHSWMADPRVMFDRHSNRTRTLSNIPFFR